jgi:hypothetical protein
MSEQKSRRCEKRLPHGRAPVALGLEQPWPRPPIRIDGRRRSGCFRYDGPRWRRDRFRRGAVRGTRIAVLGARRRSYGAWRIFAVLRTSIHGRFKFIYTFKHAGEHTYQIQAHRTTRRRNTNPNGFSGTRLIHGLSSFTPDLWLVSDAGPQIGVKAKCGSLARRAGWGLSNLILVTELDAHVTAVSKVRARIFMSSPSDQCAM